jgi:hypothetical protein
VIYEKTMPPDLEGFIKKYDQFDTLSTESHIRDSRITSHYPSLRNLSFQETRSFIAQRVYELAQKHSLSEKIIPYAFFLTRELPAFIESIMTTYDLTRFIANEKGLPFNKVLSEIVKPAEISINDAGENDIGSLVGAINMVGIDCQELRDKKLYPELTYGEKVIGCGTVKFGEMLMNYASAQGITPRLPFTVSDVSSITEYPRIPKEN